MFLSLLANLFRRPLYLLLEDWSLLTAYGRRDSPPPSDPVADPDRALDSASATEYQNPPLTILGVTASTSCALQVHKIVKSGKPPSAAICGPKFVGTNPWDARR